MIFYPESSSNDLDLMLESHPCVCCGSAKSYGVNKQTGWPYCEECNYVFAEILVTWDEMNKAEKEKRV